MPLLLVVVLLAGLAVAFVMAASRAIAPAGAHDEVGRRRFVLAFGGHRLPATLLAQTYDALLRAAPVARGAVGPETRLAEDLGLGLLDAEDVAVLVAARCGGRVPSGADLDDLGRTVRTVGDLVRYVSAHCRVEQAA